MFSATAWFQSPILLFDLWDGKGLCPKYPDPSNVGYFFGPGSLASYRFIHPSISGSNRGSLGWDNFEVMKAGQIKSRPHTTKKPPKGRKRREMGPLISGKSRLVTYDSIWPDERCFRRVEPPSANSWFR